MKNTYAENAEIGDVFTGGASVTDASIGVTGFGSNCILVAVAAGAYTKGTFAGDAEIKDTEIRDAKIEVTKIGVTNIGDAKIEDARMGDTSATDAGDTSGVGAFKDLEIYS